MADEYGGLKLQCRLAEKSHSKLKQSIFQMNFIVTLISCDVSMKGKMIQCRQHKSY